MIVVKLMGGFGNQMFQYVFGKLLEKYSGEKVFFDISYFEDMKKDEVGNTGYTSWGLPLREFEIDIFKNVSVEVATWEQINEAKNKYAKACLQIFKNAETYKVDQFAKRKKCFFI